MSVTVTRNRNVRSPDPTHVGPNPSAPNEGEDRVPTDKTPEEITDNLDKEELLVRFVEWFKSSRDHFKEHRQETTLAYAFVAGDQWDDKDREVLEKQGRPSVTFNRVQPFVDGVSGLEIGNRQALTYLPRTVEDTGVTDLLTAAGQWVRDECDADEEESEQFRDAVICGVGWTQTRLDYTEDPNGMILIERVDPLEIYADPSSRKGNYADARFVIRVKDLPFKVAEEMFPEYDAYDLHARWAEDEPDAAHTPHNARLAPFYRIDQAGEINRERMQCRLVEVEWWDWVNGFRVIGPDGQPHELSDEDAGRYRVLARLHGVKAQLIKSRKKRYYRAIVGNEVLTVNRGPDEGGFSYKAITGKRDRNMACWYGLVRGMMDPQRWANKFMSQSLHIVNTNAKGGILVETDAFVDIAEARDAWAASDSIIELNPGGLNKVKQKEVAPFPTQINQMMATALEAIPATAGINLEMIAQQQNDQSGVLEMQRKQQGMTVLSYIFNAKRRYQKEQGRLLLWMIQTFISDGRLIRIGGPENAQYVPLTHKPGVAEYDVVVDEAPTSPNMKERVWALTTQMFPLLRTLPLPPQALLEFMKYSPFPASMVQKLMQAIQQQGDPSQNPQAQSMMQLNQAKAQHLQAQAGLAQAKAVGEQANQANKAADSQRAQAEAQLAPYELQSEMDERAAKVGLLQAQAVNQIGQAFNAFQNAGIGPAQAAEEARLAAMQFEHQQHMDVASHALAVANAMQPPPPPAGPSGSSGANGGQGGPGAAGGMSQGIGMPPPPQPPLGPPGAQNAAYMHAMAPLMQPPPMGAPRHAGQIMGPGAPPPNPGAPAAQLGPGMPPPGPMTGAPPGAPPPNLGALRGAPPMPPRPTGPLPFGVPQFGRP